MMLEQRVNEALAYALGLETGHCIPYEYRRDIAQEAIIAMSEHLLTDEWKEFVWNAFMGLVKEATRKYKREQKALKEYEEWIMNKKKGDDNKRLYIRELARSATTPREWQVVHARYWRHPMTFEEIGWSLGVTKQTVWELHENALHHLRATLHAKGLTRSNWADWYFAPCQGEN